MVMNKQQALVDRAAAYPIDEIVEFYVAQLEIPLSTGRLHERELKRWLILSALNPDDELVMLSSIDEMWHAFILFTRRYAEFCDILGEFIHHRPRVGREWYRSGILERYELFHRRYEATFAETPPTDIWPRPEELALRIGEELPARTAG